ncbi:MAG TPA: NUDIX domain-containing protein [bacterium]|jgi:putative (di)nucleoside polyphosphate hydrolase|nr:NUDIX domain-containing protein [bacterium]HNW15887.1 NUDIX domain-containing protein [bacterium]HRQ68784.1 NUDIX domain-containing protein [bacterium]
MNFRKNVAAVIVDDKGLILVGKRTDVADAWQLPQGGVDKDENEQYAVLREVFEETGIQPHFLNVVKKTSVIRYLFPPEIRKGMKFDGQEQIYFLIKIVGPGWSLERSDEFFDFEWLDQNEVVKRAVEFKKNSYIEAFRQLFGVKDGI